MSIGALVRAATRRWAGPFAISRKIVKVTVRDQAFQVVSVLTSEPDLAVFCELWAAMIETDPRAWPPQATRAHYKLDVQWSARDGGTRTSRWIYHPGGYVNLLAIWRPIWVAPLYRMASPNALEVTFGLDPL